LSRIAYRHLVASHAVPRRYGRPVRLCADVTQQSKEIVIPPDVFELSTSCGDVHISQVFALTAASPLGQTNQLATADSLGLGQPRDANVFEVRSQNLTALPDMFRGNNEDQNAPELQPAKRMREEDPFGPLTLWKFTKVSTLRRGR
jgi:hypothetical protein